MKMYFGNHSSLRVILFLIVSTEHFAVQGGIFNIQSPVTIQHDPHKFLESTKDTSKLQSPANIQQEFHNFIRKTGGAEELESSNSGITSELQTSYGPPIKLRGEFNEKNSTYKREKRSLNQEQRNYKPTEPSFFSSDFGRPEFFRVERLPKNDPPQISSRPRELTNFDFRNQDSSSKQTDRPQTFFESQKTFQISSKPQKSPNQFLNQPVNPQLNPNFQSFDHRFISHNKPHTNLHNSDNFPPIKTNTKPASNVHTHSHPFHTFNTRPKKTTGHQNSQFTGHSPHSDQNLDFSRPNNRPVDFSRPNNRPVDFSSISTFNTRPKKTTGHQNSQFTGHSPHSDQNLDFSRPNNRPVDFSSISTFNTRPKKTTGHQNSQFTGHSPHSDQNLDFSRPNSRPVDFSSISTFNTRPKKTMGHQNSHFTIHSPITDQNLDFSRPNNGPVDFSSTSTFNTSPKKTQGHQNSQFTIQRPHTGNNLAFSRPNNRPVDFSSILDNPVTSAVNHPESNDDRTGNRHIRQFNRPSGYSCSTPTGFRRSGEVWFSSGCRRSKCIAFRGHSSIETDQCDTDIYNTVYSCIIEVDVKARFPGCCPRYRCNPDNLGNLVDRTFG